MDQVPSFLTLPEIIIPRLGKIPLLLTLLEIIIPQIEKILSMPIQLAQGMSLCDLNLSTLQLEYHSKLQSDIKPSDPILLDIAISRSEI